MKRLLTWAFCGFVVLMVPLEAKAVIFEFAGIADVVVLGKITSIESELVEVEVKVFGEKKPKSISYRIAVVKVDEVLL